MVSRRTRFLYPWETNSMSNLEKVTKSFHDFRIKRICWFYCRFGALKNEKKSDEQIFLSTKKSENRWGFSKTTFFLCNEWAKFEKLVKKTWPKTYPRLCQLHVEFSVVTALKILILLIVQGEVTIRHRDEPRDAAGSSAFRRTAGEKERTHCQHVIVFGSFFPRCATLESSQLQRTTWWVNFDWIFICQRF